MTSLDVTQSTPDHPADPERLTFTTDTEWHALRATGLGGSDAAAVCGLNDWRGPYAVWAEKTGRHTEVVDSEAVRWGTLLEPVILAEWAEREHVQVTSEPHMLRSREWPWMLANLDAVTDDAIVEIKTAGARQESKWVDEPPLAYWTQGLHYAAVTGRRRCVFVCLLGGQRLIVHTVDYSEASIDHLVRVERDFWSHVTADSPPPATTADVAVLSRTQPTRDAVTVPDPEQAAQLAADYQAAAAAEKKAKGVKDAAGDELRALIGEHDTAILPSGDVVATWKASARRDIDRKRLRAEWPDVAEACETVQVVRTLRIPTKANEEEGT